MCNIPAKGRHNAHFLHKVSQVIHLQWFTGLLFLPRCFSAFLTHSRCGRALHNSKRPLSNLTRGRGAPPIIIRPFRFRWPPWPIRTSCRRQPITKCSRSRIATRVRSTMPIVAITSAGVRVAAGVEVDSFVRRIRVGPALRRCVWPSIQRRPNLSTTGNHGSKSELILVRLSAFPKS